MSFGLMFAFAAPLAVPVAVSADTPNVQGSLCKGAKDLQITDGATNPTVADNCPDSAGTAGSTDRVNKLLQQIINIFSVIVGVVAVIMIIVGGFRYITSGGASEKVTSAKNTILYALIGLIIVALAQVVVRFVLSKSV